MFGAALAKTTRIGKLSLTMRMDDGPHRFMCCECNTLKSRMSEVGSVMIGLVGSQRKAAQGYSQKLMNSVCVAVASDRFSQCIIYRAAVGGYTSTASRAVECRQPLIFHV